MNRLAALLLAFSLGCSTTIGGVELDDASPGLAPPDLASGPLHGDLAAAPTNAPTADLLPSAPAVEIGEPISAPSNQWTWIDVPEMRCGNGSSSGLGVNLTDESDDVLIFLEGGGACWDAVTCWGLPGTALYFQTGYGALEFATDPQRLLYVLDRNNAQNPFRKKNLVYIPYCTGDAFAGDNVTSITYLGQERESHFVGYRNVGVALSRILATLPSAQRVWLAGDSAGGFGAAFNFGRTQDAFPGARVDVIDDSGQPIMPDLGRWQQWKALWNIQMPSDCAACPSGPKYFIDYYRMKYPASRFGLVSFDYDIVIAPFMSLTLTDFHDQLHEMADHVAYTWPNARYFFLAGASHVGLALPTPALQTWVKQLVEDDPAWDNHNP